MILLATGDPQYADDLKWTLKAIGFDVNVACDSAQIVSCLRAGRQQTAAVLLDVTSSHGVTLDTVGEVRACDSEIPVIVLSETASVPHIVAAMKTGATDFLSKPVGENELRASLLSSLEAKRGTLARMNDDRTTQQFFIGRSPTLNAIFKQLQEISWSDAPVLILGETGSGKEVIARELHAQSRRRNNRFTKLNCAALPSELIESELFGYERGAFTGAFQRQRGILEMADGGTILLDEIGDMDVGLQAKLLHVLQDREFYRVGGRAAIQIDVRVVAATHRNLEAAVVEGSFREDLFYRLNVIDLHIPPLRARKEDIAALAGFLIAKHARDGVAPPAIGGELRRIMENYPWPGNVRELENFVQRLIVTRDVEKLGQDLLMRSATRVLARTPSSDEPVTPILDQVTKEKAQAEAEAILAALNTTGWNRKEAAALLQTDYRGLLYKMKKLGIGMAVRTGDVFSDEG
jgi:two-component system, NtrC family, response regulator AtoC